MMTREEILSIEEYCAEHKISHKKRLEELGIPFWHFYKAKQKYKRADEQDAQPGQFVQLASGRYVPQTMPPARTAGKSGKPVIDNEKHRAVKGYIWAVRDAVCGDVYFHYDMGSRGGDTARKLIGGYRGTIQTDGYEVYEAYEGAPGKRMIGCWAHARRKFVEALDEDKKHASEALVYIGKLYGIEKEMQEAGLDHDAIRKRRQEESYKIIQEFENWMNSVSGRFTPKSRMGKALVYTYTLLPRLSRYVLDGRYNIDNNGVENAIRPLAIGRKNYLFCGNHDAAVRAAIVYSLFSSCKAHGVDVRSWLEDTLRRIPTEKDVDQLLPCNWQVLPANSR